MSAPYAPSAAPVSDTPAPPRIAGVLFVGLLVAAGTTSVITQFFVREVSSTRTFTGEVTRLDARVDAGRITVNRAPAGEATSVVVRTQSAFRSAGFTESFSAGVLERTGGCSGNWLLDNRCAVDFDITLAGNGAVHLRSATGNLLVVGADGPVTARTATGSIRLVGVTSSTVDAGAATGDVDVRFAAAPDDVRARTSTGSVRVVVPSSGEAYRVDARTDVGVPVIEVPQDQSSARVIDVRSSVGDVTVQTAG
jgi:hypothetical protein